MIRTYSLIVLHSIMLRYISVIIIIVTVTQAEIYEECSLEPVFGRTSRTSYKTVGCTTSNVGDYEVHVFGVYQPRRGVRLFQQSPSSVGEIQVNISYVSGSIRKPIRLVLTSYEATKWMINIPEGLRISSAFLSSYYESHCSVFVNGVQLTPQTLTISGRYYSYGQKAMARGLISTIKEMYGLVTSYTAVYETDWFKLDVGVTSLIDSEEPARTGVCATRRDGVYESPGTCDGFIKCTQDATYHMKCTGGTRWSETHRKCVVSESPGDSSCAANISTINPRALDAGTMCLSSELCLLKYPFEYDDNWTACRGDQYVTRTRYNLYLGVVACNSTRYKLYLSSDWQGRFENIADGSGHGQDHCELVGGSTVKANLPDDFWDSPSAIGYYRSNFGDSWEHGAIGFGPKNGRRWTGRYYVKWYECDMQIPGNMQVVDYRTLTTTTPLPTSPTTPPPPPPTTPFLDSPNQRPRKFAVVCPPTHTYYNPIITGHCRITVTSSKGANITIETSAQSLTQYVNKEIPYVYTQRGQNRLTDGVESKVIYITSAGDITVFVNNAPTDYYAMFDSAVVVDYHPNNTEFVLVNYGRFTCPVSEFFIIASYEDNTNVKIYQPQIGGGQDILLKDFTLNWFDTFTMKPNRTLSPTAGYRIVTTRAVNVYEGNTCAFSSQYGSGHQSFIFDSVLPTLNMGTTYVTPPITGPLVNGSYYAKVVPHFDNTKVTFSHLMKDVTLNTFQFHQVNVAPNNGMEVVTCSKPCSVSVVAKELYSSTGVFMMPVTSNDKFVKRVSFVPLQSGTHNQKIQHYVSIVVPRRQQTHNIRFNGDNIGEKLAWNVAMGGAAVAYTKIPSAADRNVTNHINCVAEPCSFAVYVYGHMYEPERKIGGGGYGNLVSVPLIDRDAEPPNDPNTSPQTPMMTSPITKPTTTTTPVPEPSHMTFKMSPQNKTRDSGDVAVFECQSDDEYATIQWYFRGQLLTDDNKPRSVMLYSSVVFIENVDKDHHAGEYKCVATNGNLTGEASGFLDVQLAVCGYHFENRPEDVVLAVGRRHIFRCHTESAKSYKWYKDGAPIPRRMRVLPNGFLLLSRVCHGDGGVYTCIAQGDQCEDKKEALLTITHNCGHPIVEPGNYDTNPEDDVDDEDNNEEEYLDYNNYNENRGMIIGGRQAKKGSAPWQVMLYENDARQFCGGVLIDKRWVLTAAHCISLFQEHFNRPLTKQALVIKLGEYDTSVVEPQERNMKARRWIVHPDYHQDTFNNDIAIIELETPMQHFTDYIKPACLTTPTVWARHLSGEGTPGYVTGWGWIDIEYKRHARIMQELRVPLQTHETCQNSTIFEITDSMICAGHGNGVRDTCRGDSGGPLVMHHEGAWHLVGLVSWGTPDCARQGRYGFYTRVDKYYDWIVNTIGKHC